MKIYRLLIIGILLVILTAGAVSAADNTDLDDVVSASDLPDDFTGKDALSISVDENDDIGYDLSRDVLKSPAGEDVLSEGNNETSYDNQYYVFRGDCWTIVNNFESSAAITSENLTDFTVTGTFRTQNDLIGLFWNSQDPIQHPYISYGNRSDYTDVILEFDYEMTGCMDFSNTNIEIKANTGETYYLTMSRFINNNHVTLNFNNLTLLPGNTYYDKGNNPINVVEVTKLNVTDLMYVKFFVEPANYDYAHITIMENVNFTCKVSNISVANGEICSEQPALQAHNYSLCEGYDDSYNLNPFRLAKEMRKLGYANWVDLYIGASYYYEKNGTAGDVITEMNLNQDRTEMMVLDKNVPLNNAFKAWLDCYSRELKNNGIRNLVISVSMENLQCPQSWRQMDANGTFAMSGWEPSTFLFSPCNDEAVRYMKNVSEACLDIVVNNGLQPILQMGETWWWWNEKAPYFYDNSTKAKYLAENGVDLPGYTNVRTEGYDKIAIKWLNQQLVQYGDALREVVKNGKYDNGLFVALLYLPSVIADSVPPMIRDVNYLNDTYSPDKLDILQIEDYDWVIYQSSHHSEAYAIGQELGFSQDRMHYFGGFVQNPDDADTYWPLIEKSMEDAKEKNFEEVFVWAGSQVRRDNKILGYDKYAILKNIQLSNQPGIVSPIITAPEYASVSQNFTIKIHTNDWIGGVLNVYEYDNCEKGNLLASNNITDGNSSVILSSAKVGLNKFYLEFDYIDGKYHLIQGVYIIENSKNITADVSDEVEIGSDANITFSAPISQSTSLYITVDGKTTDSYLVENGEFSTKISDLSAGYHTILLSYNDGYYDGNRLLGEVYYKNFRVKVGVKTYIEARDINTTYDSGENLVITLKDSNGNDLRRKDILISLNGTDQTLATNINGQVLFGVEVLPGNYTAAISYAGDDTYLSFSTTADVIVNKLATNLTAKNISLTYGDDANLVITLKDNNNHVVAGKEISIILNEENHTLTTNNKGQVELKIDLYPKNYTAQISYSGNEIYLPSTASADIEVKKLKTNLTTNDISIYYNDPTNLVVTLKDSNGNVLNGKDVLVSLDGLNHTTDDNGQVAVPIKNLPGTYTIDISFAGDDIYLPALANSEIEVKKLTTTLTTNDICIYYGDFANLVVTLKDGNGNVLNGKDVLVSLDGLNHTTDDNGQVALTINKLPGTYSIDISFAEDDIYLPSVASSEIVVKKLATNLTTNDISIYYGDSANLVITLKDSNGNVLVGKYLLVSLDGLNHTTDDNGQIALPINKLPGTYIIDMSFDEDNIYLPSCATAEIVVKRLATNLTTNDISIYYGDSANLVITLKDDNGNVLAGKDVLVSLDGLNHTTDDNGQIALPINKLPGTYAINLSFGEDNIYLSSSASAEIEVKKLTTNLTTNDINIYYGDSANLVVTLKDAKGNVLKGKDVLVSLDGLNHTTDDNGQIALPINKLPGTYAIDISFAEDDIYLPSVASSEIVVKKLATNLTTNDISIYYGDSANLVITLKDDNGNVLAGKDVLVSFDGLNHTTDNNGQIALPINKLPGTYAIDVSFGEDNIYLSSSASAEIEVKKLTTNLTTNDISIYYGDSANLVVTLKDANGNVLVGEDVLVSLDGLNHTTDDNGQIALPINKLPGTYAIDISFAEDDIYLPSVASSEIVVKKLATNLTTNDISIYYGDSANLVVTLKDAKGNVLAGKNVLVSLDGLNHTTDENGQIALPINKLPGTYTIDMSFDEDEIYLPSLASAEIEVKKLTTNLITNDISIYYNDPTDLVATLKDSKGNVLKGKIISLDGSNYTTDDNGQIALPINKLPGNYTAELTYAGDNIYLPSSASANITVKKLTTNLITNDISIYYNDPTDLVATLKDSKGNVLKGKIISLDGSNYTTDENGQIALPINKFPGNYTAELSFTGDDIYVSSSATANININKLRTNLTVNDIILDYGDSGDLVATLKDSNGNPLAARDVSIRLCGLNHTLTTDDYGKVALAIDLLPGNYSAEIYYAGDNVYVSSSASAHVDVSKIKTSLNANDISFIYSDATNLVVSLKDSKGNALKEKQINITLNRTNHVLTTNSEGMVALAIDLLPGNYSAEICYAGDNVYVPSSATADVNVNKLKTSLNANDISFIYGDVTNLVITLKDYKGNALKGKDISINLDGSKHLLTTDKDGQVTLPVNNLPGNYTAEISYAGDNVYLLSSSSADVYVNKIKTSLITNDISLIYAEPTNLTVTLKDSRGNALKGKDILIYLNGLNHTLTADDNGQVALPIDLLAGNYAAKVSYAGDGIYESSSATAYVNVSKLKTILTTNDISFIYGDVTNLVVTLKDGRSNALKGKEISITLNGSNHTLTTDDNGQVALPIDLLPGNYDAEISYAGNNAYLSSSATAKVIVNKLATILTANNLSAVYGDPASLVITLKDYLGNVLKGKEITITVNSQKFNKTTDNNGMVFLPVDYNSGNYEAYISFTGDERYVSSSARSNIAVSKITTQIIASNMTVNLTKQNDLVATLKDDKGNALSAMNLVITLNGNAYTRTTDDSGRVSLPLNLSVGSHDASIRFAGSQNYDESICNVKIIVLDKIVTYLQASVASVSYGVASKLVITLKDENENVLSGQKIAVNLNRNVYYVTTDEKGQAILSKALPANTYNTNIAFAGDDNYKPSSGTVKVVVKKATPTLAVSSKTFLAKTKTKKVTVTLKNRNVFLKNAIVKLTVNKKTYTARTNSKGVATFTVKLTKKGQYTAVYRFDANSNFNRVIKNAKILIR